MGFIDSFVTLIRNIVLAVLAILAVVLVVIIAYYIIKCCVDRAADASKDE